MKNRGRQRQQRINDTLRLLDIHSRYVNHIRLHNSTSKEHMNKMCEICIWLKENDMDFVTEAKFIDGGRADIVVLEEAVAIEIGHTETVEKFDRKNYPIQAIFHKTDQPWRGL